MRSWLGLGLGLILVGSCSGVGDEAVGFSEPAVDEVVGQAPAAVGGRPSIVVLQPELAGGAPAAGPVMDQIAIQFFPRLLLATVGRPVVFRNSEEVTHNVHIRSVDGDSTVYNLDTDPSEQIELIFEHPGGYDVLCDIHPGMTAFLFVAPPGLAAFAAEDGGFSLAGVPPGSYTLTVWSADPDRRGTLEIQVGSGRTEVHFPTVP